MIYPLKADGHYSLNSFKKKQKKHSALKSIVIR